MNMPSKNLGSNQITSCYLNVSGGKRREKNHRPRVEGATFIRTPAELLKLCCDNSINIFFPLAHRAFFDSIS